MKGIVVGLGSMGKKHYNILKQIPEVKELAVCDLEAKTEKNSFNDLDEAIISYMKKNYSLIFCFNQLKKAFHFG